jgi:uncharacterized protein (UPF0218 family)
MPISQKDAQLLKQPFGTLIPDKQVTKQKVASVLKGASRVIAVGDATTECLASFGITPDIAVIDGKERRSKRNYPANYPAKELRCSNPAGTISKDAVKVLQEALKSHHPPVRVLVDGEEDLLALPVFAMAPEGSAVLYGQPLEGLVLVRMTPAKQKQAKDLMDRIVDNANLISSHNSITDNESANGTPKIKRAKHSKSGRSPKKD